MIGERLRRLRASTAAPSIPIGVNLGKSKVTPLAEAPADYLYSFRQLAPVADYVVLNVSSPNTPGLRNLQERDALVSPCSGRDGRECAAAIPKPLLLKIAPDLSDEALGEIVSVCEEFGIGRDDRAPILRSITEP